jgi:hypothetical protein
MIEKVFETNLVICVATFVLFLYPLAIPIKLADEMKCVLNLCTEGASMGLSDWNIHYKIIRKVHKKRRKHF